MAIKNTTDVLVLVGATAISNLLDASVSINGEAVNITTKDSGKYEEFFHGAVNGTMSASGLYEDGGLDVLDAAMVAGTELTLKFGNANVGEEYWSASGFVTNITINSGGYQQAATFDVSFQLSGTITKADN